MWILSAVGEDSTLGHPRPVSPASLTLQTPQRVWHGRATPSGPGTLPATPHSFRAVKGEGDRSCLLLFFRVSGPTWDQQEAPWTLGDTWESFRPRDTLGLVPSPSSPRRARPSSQALVSHGHRTGLALVACFLNSVRTKQTPLPLPQPVTGPASGPLGLGGSMSLLPSHLRDRTPSPARSLPSGLVPPKGQSKHRSLDPRSAAPDPVVSQQVLWSAWEPTEPCQGAALLGRGGWGQMGGLQASPDPCSHFSAFLSLSITEASLADWLLRKKSLGNPIVRFDASLASLLALPVGMAVASQSKGALCWNLGHRPRPKHLRAPLRWFPSHPTLKLGLVLIWAGCSVRKGLGPDTGPAAQGAREQGGAPASRMQACGTTGV